MKKQSVGRGFEPLYSRKAQLVDIIRKGLKTRVRLPPDPPVKDKSIDMGLSGFDLIASMDEGEVCRSVNDNNSNWYNAGTSAKKMNSMFATA